MVQSGFISHQSNLKFLKLLLKKKATIVTIFTYHEPVCPIPSRA